MAFASSLTNRIFLASSALAVVSIGVAVLVVNAAVTAQAERELARGLEEAAALVEEYRTRLFDQFRVQARLVADLPRLKAAVSENDPPTVEPIAREYEQQLKPDVFVVTNRSGRVLARFGAGDLDDAAIARLPAVADALAGRERASFWPRAGGLLQAVTVPMLVGQDLVGTLSVGFAMDERVAAEFKAATDSEIAFAVDGSIQAATLPAERWPVIAGLLGGRDLRRVVVGSEDYVAVTRPLAVPPDSNGTPALEAADSSRAPTAVILRSRTERLRFLRSLHTQLAATALVAVLIATLLSYGIARTVTRPLGAITATMREMSATGDLTRRIPTAESTAWHDEDARLLAATFNAMTESIVRFQREAAQRERLSSLGRLSTVIAHEVRNPLMIIKASLRLLKRAEVNPQQVQTAVVDIEEETARLNRIVTDVLDFARPISFDLAPADLNAICRGAVQAVETDGSHARVTLILDERLPPVVTDAERLRRALVNVLGNAQQAVQAAPAGPGAAPPPQVELVTMLAGQGRVAVAVRDNGPGIAPDDLPRIFEPYFTTKRTGSGLGLAITKNIVEGLGGTLTVRNRTGGGAEIEFNLPIERRP